MFTISSSQPLKPVSKEQTLKYPERKGGFKFPTLYWGNGSLERPGIRVSKLRLGYWSYEGSGGWRYWGKCQEVRGFRIWLTSLFVSSPSPLSLVSSLENWFFFFFKILLGGEVWVVMATQFRAAVFRVCVEKSHMVGRRCFETYFHFEKQLLSLRGCGPTSTGFPWFPLLSSNPLLSPEHLPLDHKLLEGCTPDPFISEAWTGVDSTRSLVNVQLIFAG